MAEILRSVLMGELRSESPSVQETLIATRRSVGRILAIGGLGLALGGCGLLPGRRRREIEVGASTGLSDAVLAVHEDREPRDVAAATGDEIDWDRFTVCTIGTPAETINDASGLVVETGEHYSTQEILLVFHRDGTAVRGVPSGFEDLADGTGTWWGPRTQLVWDERQGVGFHDPDA